MKKTRNLLIIMIVGLALLLSSCSSRGRLPTSWPGITVTEERIYVAYNTQVHAINSNGLKQAQYPAEPTKTTYFAPPVFAGDQMLIAGYDNTLYSYNPVSGAENWTFDNNNRFIASPLVLEDGIYAPNADHNLYALSLNGSLRWTFETADPLWATPVTDGEKLYLAAMDHNVYAINPANGQQIWSTDIGGTTVSTPTLSEEGLLYVGTFEKEVVALKTANGSEVWRTAVDGWVWGSPVLVDGTLYVTDLEGKLYALDAATGNMLWQVTGDGAIAGSALVLEDTIYFSTDAGTLFAITLEGATRWTKNTPEAQLHATPVAFGDLILVGAVEVDPLIIAYDATGAIQWQFIPEN